jgi:hypothetical protein
MKPSPRLSPILLAASALALPGVAVAQGSSSSQAQAKAPASSPVQSTVRTQAKPELKRWGVVLGATFDTSLHTFDDPAKRAKMLITTSPTYQWSELYKSKLNLVTQQDLRGDQDTTVYKASVSLSRAPIALNPFVSFQSAVSVGLPLSASRRDRESYLTGVSLIPRVTLDPSGGRGGKLQAYWEGSVARLFHRYDTQTNGASNNRYSASNEIGAGYDLGKGLSLSASYLYSMMWTYKGNQRAKFSFDGSLDWQVSEPMSVGLGYSNGGDPLKDNGIDSNIAVFDAENSSVSAGVTFVF